MNVKPDDRPTPNARRQSRRIAGMTAAAKRDGFATWSAALTAWLHGRARLVRVPPDYNPNDTAAIEAARKDTTK